MDNNKNNIIHCSQDLRYTKGYKYRTSRTFWTFSNIFPFEEIQLGRITLTTEGLLIIDRGYSSDGPSGPTWDTLNFMPGAIGWHDPIYELLRCGELDHRCDIKMPDSRPAENIIYTVERRIVYHASHDDIRREADRFLADLLILSGMTHFRIKYIYDGLRVGGESSAKDQRKIYIAPSINKD